MPLNIDLQQILLHLLNFVILATGLSLLLFRPVRKFMQERRAYYENLEAKNAQAAKENEERKSAYEEKLRAAEEEIRLMRANEEAQLAEESRICLEKAKEKASAILANAERDAEIRKIHLLESAQTEIGELVISATEKLLSETAGPQHDSALYDAFLKVTSVPAQKENEDTKA